MDALATVGRWQTYLGTGVGGVVILFFVAILLYVGIKSSTDKYVSVINSLTGEIVYSTYTPVSYNIKSGDLESIQRKIQ